MYSVKLDMDVHFLRTFQINYGTVQPHFLEINFPVKDLIYPRVSFSLSGRWFLNMVMRCNLA